MESEKDRVVIQMPEDLIYTSSASPEKPDETPRVQSLTRRKSAAISESSLVESTENSKSASVKDKDKDKEDDYIYDIMGTLKATLVMTEVIVFVLIMGLLISSSTLNKLKKCVIWDLELWKWCFLALVILSGRLVSQWFVDFLVFLMEKNFMLKHLVLYFVYALRTSVNVFIWLTLVLLAWILLFEHGVKRSKRTSEVVHYITRTLVSFLVGAVLWLVKTFSVKLVAVSFHCERFFDRIQDSIFHQFVLQALSSSRSTIAKRFILWIEKGKNKEKKIDAVQVKRLKKDKVSAWHFKDLISVIHDSKLSIMSQGLDDNKYNEIKNESEAEVFADQIFADLVADHPHSQRIGEEQLLRFLHEKQHVEHMLKQFEGAETTGNVCKSDFKRWVVKVYKERESLKRSLIDSKTALEELNRILSALVIVLIIILWLVVMGLLTTKILVIFSSQLILLAFIFGSSAKALFEAIIFVFVTHPFDVGDRCLIDGMQMVVHEMNILTTIFLKYDMEKIYYPNSVLATKPISNFFRSPPEMGDSVEFTIDVFTSVEIIEKLKDRIKKYLENKKEHWQEAHSVVVKDIGNLNQMKMALYVSHTINFQDYLEKDSRRSELVFKLKQIFEELGIKYDLLPEEVHVSPTGLEI